MSEKIYDVPAEWASRAFVDDAKYREMYDRSIKDPEGFWREEAKRVFALFRGHMPALRRIDQGTYGACRDCGEPIAKARLEAIPWTRVCISCKEKQK